MEALEKQARRGAHASAKRVVKQSGELQNQLQTLLNDLLDLAKDDDKDAKEIIGKWNVQRNAASGAGARPLATSRRP